MQAKNFFIFLIAVTVFIILLISWMGWQGYKLRKKQGAEIITDKEEYDSSGILKLKIKNNFLESICFSSCYPYYLQSKDENWRDYKYQECHYFDSDSNCIGSGKEKFFELTLPEPIKGVHRLVIPICVDCEGAKEFKEEMRFYSNEFIAK